MPPGSRETVLWPSCSRAIRDEELGLLENFLPPLWLVLEGLAPIGSPHVPGQASLVTGTGKPWAVQALMALAANAGRRVLKDLRDSVPGSIPEASGGSVELSLTVCELV